MVADDFYCLAQRAAVAHARFLRLDRACTQLARRPANAPVTEQQLLRLCGVPARTRASFALARLQPQLEAARRDLRATSLLAFEALFHLRNADGAVIQIHEDGSTKPQYSPFVLAAVELERYHCHNGRPRVYAHADALRFKVTGWSLHTHGHPVTYTAGLFEQVRDLTP